MAGKRKIIIFDTCPFCGKYIRSSDKDMRGKPAGVEIVYTKRNTRNYFHKACYEQSLRK